MNGSDLLIKDVNKTFGDTVVLNNVNLEIKKGEYGKLPHSPFFVKDKSVKNCNSQITIHKQSLLQICNPIFLQLRQYKKDSIYLVYQLQEVLQESVDLLSKHQLLC